MIMQVGFNSILSTRLYNSSIQPARAADNTANDIEAVAATQRNEDTTCNQPLLLLKKVDIGAGCSVGHRAVLPTGCQLPHGTAVASADTYQQQPAGEHLGKEVHSEDQLLSVPYNTRTESFYAERFMSKQAVWLAVLLALLLDVLLSYPGTFLLYYIIQVSQVYIQSEVPHMHFFHNIHVNCHHRSNWHR